MDGDNFGDGRHQERRRHLPAGQSPMDILRQLTALVVLEVQHRRRPGRPTRREGERGTRRWCPLCHRPTSGRCRCDSLAVLGCFGAVPRPKHSWSASWKLPRRPAHCRRFAALTPEDGSGTAINAPSYRGTKRDNPRRSPRVPRGSEHDETPVSSSLSTASCPAAQQRYLTDLVLRERARPGCLCLAAEHSTDLSELASIDDQPTIRGSGRLKLGSTVARSLNRLG